MKNLNFGSVLAGVLLLGVTAPAGAAVITYSADYASAANPVDIGSADLPTVSLQKFDTSLGTLTDIIIKLSSVDSVQTLVANFGPATSFQQAQTAATITVTGQDGTQAISSLTTTPFSGAVGAGSFASPQFNNNGPIQQQSSPGAGFVSPANFSAYEAFGGGALDYSLSASVVATSSGTSLPYVFFGYKATSYGSVEIDYDYTPISVPESTTAFAGCFALAIGCFTVARRRPLVV